MSIKLIGVVPGMALALGLFFAAGIAAPAASAGETMEIAPAENAGVPEGSRIPERRLDEIQQKVQAYQSKMRAKAAQGQQTAPQQTPQNPNNNQ